MNLNVEYVIFENIGNDPLDMPGWTVADEVGRTYTISDRVTVNPGAMLTLRTESGADTETELYWWSGSSMWNNDEDTVIVTTDGDGGVVEERY